jgi:type I restriction-modification system DNA methylase subunit
MNQHELNTEIAEFIRMKDDNNDAFSREDIEYIKQYEGSGGQGKHGATGEGVLYEFYTPDFVSDLMLRLAQKHGYSGGKVLEPSCGTGRLLLPFQNKSDLVGFEINPTSVRIAELSNPGMKVYRGYFETAFMKPPRFTERIKKNEFTWIDGYPFSLIIGNPPYGKYKNKYSSFFSTPKIKQIEIFFMYYGMQCLSPGGLLIYLTSSNFLRNGISYNSEKQLLEPITEIVDAYRLPAVFRFSEVPTDIIVFKRK